MQSTPPVPAPATPATPVTVSPESLAAAFDAVPDPRRQASITYALSAILTLAVVAILANHRSVLAIAEWGARQSPGLLQRLGFPDGCTPCQSTLQRLFAKLDGHTLAVALTAHFAPADAPGRVGDDVQGIAIDGKAQRGRLQYDSGGLGFPRIGRQVTVRLLAPPVRSETRRAARR